MNKEIIKAMQGKKEHKARKWWRKNGYKVWRVILFPAWFYVLFNNWRNNRLIWSEERANKILSYYVPRAAVWDEKNQSFGFFDNGMRWGFGLAKKYLKRKDYRFWKKWNWKIKDFLENKFELEGFTKINNYRWEGWTDISFLLKKKD